MYPSYRAGLSLLAAAAVSAAPLPALACAACGCTVGTEWAGAGYSTGTGWRVESALRTMWTRASCAWARTP